MLIGVIGFKKQDWVIFHVAQKLKEQKLLGAEIYFDFFPQRAKSAIALGRNKTQDSFCWSSEKIKKTSVYLYRPMIPVLGGKDIKNQEVREFARRESTNFVNNIVRKLSEKAVLVNSTESMNRSNNKLTQLEVARELGWAVPETLFTNDADEVRAFFRTHKKGIIIKGASTGQVTTKKGLYTSEVGKEHLKHLGLLRNAPAYFQEKIEKIFEARVTIFGKKIFPVRIESQEDMRAKTDWRLRINVLPHSPMKLPKQVEKRCFDIMGYFGLSYGAIDLAHTPKREWVFFEINSCPQFGWLEAKTGLPLLKEFIEFLKKQIP